MSVFPPAITQMKVSFHAHYSAETQRKPKRAANLLLVALHALQANFNRRIIGRLPPMTLSVYSCFHLKW
jgi:hypothetical protein